MRRQVIFFKSHQGLEADYVAVKYNANTWVQGSTVQIFIPRSLVHSQPFFNIGLELIKLPYCYHCLPSICSKILSSHTIVWILATAFSTGDFYSRIQAKAEGGSTYHTSLGISFDRPMITSGKKIVILDEVSVMVLTMISV